MILSRQKGNATFELINERRTFYDVKRYKELLPEACNSVTEPFGLKMTLPSSGTSMKSYPVIGEGSGGCEGIS